MQIEAYIRCVQNMLTKHFENLSETTTELIFTGKYILDLRAYAYIYHSHIVSEIVSAPI